jgi:hypothetical protein
MPNWCYNSLEIYKNEDGQKLIDAFVGGKPFETLMPCPQELHVTAGFFGEGTEEQKKMDALYASNKEKYGFQHWYDWCWAKWGVKWDASDIDVSDHDDSDTVMIHYQTPWNDAGGFFQHVAEILPKAIFVNEYSEEGCAFAGYNLNGVNGYQEESWEVHEAPRIEDLIEELDEETKSSV